MSSNAGIAALRGAVTALQAEPLPGVPGPTLAEDLIELRRLAHALDAEWLRRLAAFDARGAAVDAGAVSTAAWLRSACRMAPGSARGRVELARALPERTAVAAALSAGEISAGHAQQVVAAVTELAAAAGAETAAQAEPAAVEVARRVDPARLHRELIRVRAALAPHAAARAADVAYGRRRLSISQTFDDLVALDGILDPEGGAVLLTALAPLSARSGPNDVRTPAQRRADALVELCHRQLNHGHLPETGGERPHLTVLVDLDTLSNTATPAGPAQRPPDHTSAPPQEPAATGPGRPPAEAAGPAATATDESGRPPARAADGSRRPAAGADVGPASPAAAEPTGGPRTRLARRTAETEWAGPISGEAACRIACDAAVTRVITTGASQPLDVGRRTRTIPPAIRTALIVRDRGCAFPHCDRPPPWTDAHHLHHWAHGGPTSLDNLILLCRRHHRAVHEGGWQLSRTPAAGWTAHRPHTAGAGPPTAA